MAEEHFFYRFRTLKHIFEYKELENQEIYFASPEELNDPMECYVNLIFNGDEIAWNNLFKHYLMCLFLTINEIGIRCSNDISFFKTPFIALTCIDKDKHKFYKQNFYKIYKKLRNDNELNIWINKLTNIDITKYQLEYILLVLNYYFIMLIMNELFKIDKEKIIKLKEATYEALNNLINDIKKNNTHNSLSTYNNLIALFNQIILDKDYIFMYDGFHYQYIEWLPKLLSTDSNIACFTTDFSNSYMWSIYGDKNNGISLMYKINNNKFYLLDENDKEYKNEYEIKQVNYGKAYAKINFFEYNYLKFFILTNNFWYKDYISGSRSKFYFDKTVDNVDKLEESEELMQIYTNNMEIILNNYIIKTKEWEYEQEYRIIIQTKQKIYKYDFQDLHGLIFGIGTPFDAKQKNVKIILDKCEKNQRDIKDFHFYQAYFNPDTNQIEKYEIFDLNLYTPHGA